MVDQEFSWKTITEITETIDIMPTILHGLGIDEKTSLSKIQGQNLISIIENSDENNINSIQNGL